MNIKLLAGWSLALAFAVFSGAQTLTPVCSTPFCTVSASHVTDASGKGVNGTIVFQSTDGAGNPLNLTVPNSGQAVATQVSAPITNGAFSLSLADTTQTAPKNACYRAYVANAAGKVILGSNLAAPGAPLQCVQTNPTWCSATGCNFDNYPTSAALWTVYPNVASALTLGGVLIPPASGLVIDGAGHLSIDWTRSPLRSVNGQVGDVTLTIPTDTNQLANSAGFVTALQAANAAPVQAIQINGVPQTPVGGVINLPIANNPLQSIQINGVSQTPAAGVVNVVVPTDTNQLSNTAGFVVASQAASAAPVQSVAGKKGAISLLAADISDLGTAATQPASAFDPVGAAAQAVAGIPTASGTASGLLKKSDWLVFNSKQPALGFTPPNPANNLSEYAGSAAQARANLGLASAATQPASAFEPAGAAAQAQAAAISVANANTQAALAGLNVSVAQNGSNAPIQSIQVNGATQTPVSGVVNLTVPTAAIQAIQVNGTAQPPAAGGIVNLTIPANPIQTLQVNGVAQTPASGVVNVVVPTNNNQVANGAGYVTAAQAATAAPVQTVAGRTGPVTLTHNDITDWTAATSGFGGSNGSGGATGSPAAFGTLSGAPTDNTALTAALNAKQNALTFPLPIAQGGTGTTTPGISSTNANCTVGGAWPNQTITCAGGSSGAAAATGTLAAIPAACATGALYVAADQPAAQQLYTCSSANTWTPNLNLGASGALGVTNGSLDIVPSVVPRLAATNSFTGTNSFSGNVNLTGNVNFTGASVTGLSGSGSGGASVGVNSPYLTIGGVNYIPMANMAQATLFNPTGWATDTSFSGIGAAPTVTTTGFGAAAPIVTNANSGGANLLHAIPANATKFRVGFVGTSHSTSTSNSGFGIMITNGGLGLACTVRTAPTNGAQQTNQLVCSQVSGGALGGASNIYTAAYPANAWLGFDASNAGTGNSATIAAQISTDGGRTWTTVFSPNTGNCCMGINVPTKWGFYADPSEGAQILSVTEQ